MRKPKPKGTILCFNTGKVILIGGQTEREAEVTAMQAFIMIEKLLNRKDLKMTRFRVTNVVANAAVGFEIDLVKLCLDKDVAIKNDRFPGIVYKGISKVIRSVLVFASGKMVLTGAGSLDALE